MTAGGRKKKTRRAGSRIYSYSNSSARVIARNSFDRVYAGLDYNPPTVVLETIATMDLNLLRWIKNKIVIQQ